MKLKEGYRLIIYPVRLDDTVKKILYLTLDPAVYVKDYFPLIQERNELKQILLHFDPLKKKAKEWREEDPTLKRDKDIVLHRGLQLFGKQIIRNVFCSREIYRIKGELPHFEEEDFLNEGSEKSGAPPKSPQKSFNPNFKDCLTYAVSLEETMEPFSGIPTEVAFLVGFYFDLLKASLFKIKDSREAQFYLETEWKPFLKRVEKKIEEASKDKTIQSAIDLFLMLCFSQLESVLMRAIYPKATSKYPYAEVSKKWEKTKVGHREIIKRMEEKKLYTHSGKEWSLLFIKEIGFFEGDAIGLYYLEEPELIQDANRLKRVEFVRSTY